MPPNATNYTVAIVDGILVMCQYKWAGKFLSLSFTPPRANKTIPVYTGIEGYEGFSFGRDVWGNDFF